MTDYVDTVLDFLDTNWISETVTKPLLVDGRDTSEYGTQRRDITVDLTKHNVITVEGADTDRTPEGVGYSHDRVEAAVPLRIEGLDASEYGHIDNAGVFDILVSEAERALRVERKRPLPDVYRLELSGRDDLSIDGGDYYRVDLTAAFVGIDTLP